ncbi:hypothetical protein DL95DRAFT_391290 [Leptodontidium sp. 2 PMI_412]|nr:hypothetical protein DL95DRAFT_391290 [Leptodontidium sp. 2 PMI_412]
MLRFCFLVLLLSCFVLRTSFERLWHRFSITKHHKHKQVPTNSTRPTSGIKHHPFDHLCNLQITCTFLRPTQTTSQIDPRSTIFSHLLTSAALYPPAQSKPPLKSILNRRSSEFSSRRPPSIHHPTHSASEVLGDPACVTPVSHVVIQD